MATLKTFTVDSFNKNFNFLEWEFNEPVPTGNKEIEIYRSEHPGETLTDFDLVETVDVTEGFYVDTGIENLYEHNRKWYYYLNIVDNNTSAETLLLTQPVTSYDQPTDYAAREILYRKDLSLKRFTQRTFYLLKRRTWGTHCSICWDETLFRAADPNCSVCYGTGWEMGYFSPVRFQCMVTPSPSYNQLLPFARWKPSDILLTMLNFPNIVEQDIIVDDKGDRWIVVQKRSVEKLGRVIEQSVQMSKIMPDDIVYTVPITVNKFNDVITFLDDPTLDNEIIYPTYLAPTLTLSDNGETNIIVESGTSIDSASLIPTWTPNDAGLVTSYTLYKNSGMVVSSGVGFEYDVPTFNIGLELVKYYSIVAYEQGEVKNDSEGNPYPIGRISAGTKQSNDVTYQGVKLAFGGVDGSTTNIRTLSSTIFNPIAGSSMTLTDVTGDTAIFAYPATLRNLTGATFYSGGFTFNILNEVTRLADQQVNDAAGANPITYKVYRYDPVANFINVNITFTI